jgi:hypothetical protein
MKDDSIHNDVAKQGILFSEETSRRIIAKTRQSGECEWISHPLSQLPVQ